MTNITRDSRLIALLPEKTNEFYPLSNFYKEFTNFKLTEQEFFRFDGFEEKKYRFSDREISDTFKIHIFHSNAHQTRYIFYFLLVSKFPKLDRNLRIIFSVTCRKTTQKLLPQKKYILKEKLEILYTLLIRQDNLIF